VAGFQIKSDPLEMTAGSGQTCGMYRFALAHAQLVARRSGALFWPDQSVLIVSDLHFGKSERIARRGGVLLPPYETRETLSRLGAELDATRAQRVVCLGDSFDDLACPEAMQQDDFQALAQLMAGRAWHWIEGNHDAGAHLLAGSHHAEMSVEGLTLRHIATKENNEISGHYHPKARLSGRARPCFLIDSARVILPAFGTYTGGLWADDPAITALMAPDAVAVLTGNQALPIPLARIRQG
jgi:DNA ligase-associated metallophosphoesterase